MEFNPDLKTSWVMIPGLIGLVMAVIGTLITSIGMVREREARHPGAAGGYANLRPAQLLPAKFRPTLCWRL